MRGVGEHQLRDVFVHVAGRAGAEGSSDPPLWKLAWLHSQWKHGYHSQSVRVTDRVAKLVNAGRQEALRRFGNRNKSYNTIDQL